MTATAATISRGVLSLDGVPQFLLSADYPYYRDDVSRWRPQLERLKELGVTFISFYTPWRHHEVNGELDFTGRTLPSRNVIGFLKLCQELDLKVILKPGPFIHAELNFGGLPDRMDPTVDPLLEPMLNAAGEVRPWHRPLPAPLAERWQSEVSAWFQAVRRELIEPFAAPAGPIIALQVLNEGIYSDANRTFTAYDYSPSALAFYAEWQRAQGRQEIADAPRQAPASLPSLADALPYLDWALAMGGQLAECYRFAAAELVGTRLPIVSNMHPPENAGAGLDWWLAKVTPEDWGPVAYGFTNWIGVVSHDESAYLRYMVLVKRAGGPNMEENWGFSDIYDPRYKHTVIPFYQTLLAMAAGTSGINIYTGVGTDGWLPDLDERSGHPYPDTAPIGPDGVLHPKARTLSLLSTYLGRYGQEWIEAAPNHAVTWAIYPPYAALAGWGLPAEAWAAVGVNPPVAGAGGLDGFMAIMRAENRDFGLMSLGGTGAIDPAEYPALTLVGGFFMDEATQARLADYVRAGGTLIVARELPKLDGDLKTPCTLLADVVKSPGAGWLVLVPGNPFAPGAKLNLESAFLTELWALGLQSDVVAHAKTTQAWIRRHPGGRAAHVVVLSRANEAMTHHVWFDGIQLSVDLPARSAALIRLADGRLSSVLVKGINDCDGVTYTPAVDCGGERISASGPGDWLWDREHGEVFIPWDWR